MVSFPARPARVRELIDRGPYTATEALGAHLVDALEHGDEIETAIGQLLGRPVEVAPAQTSPRRPRSFASPAVAVIYVEGDIVDGRSRTIPLLDMKLVGHQSLIESIEAARADPRVGAIVMRIDSPGGSALASDLIARVSALAGHYTGLRVKGGVLELSLDAAVASGHLVP